MTKKCLLRDQFKRFSSKFYSIQDYQNLSIFSCCLNVSFGVDAIKYNLIVIISRQSFFFILTLFSIEIIKIFKINDFFRTC